MGILHDSLGSKTEFRLHSEEWEWNALRSGGRIVYMEDGATFLVKGLALSGGHDEDIYQAAELPELVADGLWLQVVAGDAEPIGWVWVVDAEAIFAHYQKKFLGALGIDGIRIDGQRVIVDRGFEPPRVK